MSVINDVCSVQGHSIVTALVKQNYDPMQKIVLNVYQSYCVQCGNDLEYCKSYAGRPSRRKDHVNTDRKSKSGSTASTAKEARNPEDRNESRVGSQPSVPEPEMSRDPQAKGSERQPVDGAA